MIRPSYVTSLGRASRPGSRSTTISTVSVFDGVEDLAGDVLFIRLEAINELTNGRLGYWKAL
jgi:hypothetical protein